MNTTLRILLRHVVKIILLLVAIAYFTLAERKIRAAIQRRRGPNVVGFFGLLQPLADGLKLIAKERIIPSHANSRIFVIAPRAVLTFALRSWGVIPFGCLDYSEHRTNTELLKALSEAPVTSNNVLLKCSTNVIQHGNETRVGPLQQFEIVSPCQWSSNLSNAWRVALTIFALTLIVLSVNKPTKYDYVISSGYTLVKSIVKENLYIKKQQYFTSLFFLFFSIFLLNLVGLIPFGFTVTSSFGVTFFLALTYFVGTNLIGVVENKWQQRNLILPQDVPLAISHFLILIEAVSYIARAPSLSIRLFANRRSGHALLKILTGFALARGSSTTVLLNFLATIPWVIVTGVRFLELLIAFLQAYVFTILVTLYINDNLNLH